MPKVNSTSIARVSPGITGDRFTVHFHSGERYEVVAPLNVYRSLRSAQSVGSFYNTQVRGKYLARKL
jgi:hypothetical protein